MIMTAAVCAAFTLVLGAATAGPAGGGHPRVHAIFVV